MIRKHCRRSRKNIRARGMGLMLVGSSLLSTEWKLFYLYHACLQKQAVTFITVLKFYGRKIGGGEEPTL